MPRISCTTAPAWVTLPRRWCQNALCDPGRHLSNNALLDPILIVWDVKTDVDLEYTSPGQCEGVRHRQSAVMAKREWRSPPASRWRTTYPAIDSLAKGFFRIPPLPSSPLSCTPLSESGVRL